MKGAMAYYCPVVDDSVGVGVVGVGVGVVGVVGVENVVVGLVPCF